MQGKIQDLPKGADHGKHRTPAYKRGLPAEMSAGVGSTGRNTKPPEAQSFSSIFIQKEEQQ